MTIALGAELSQRGIDAPEIVARELMCVIRDTILNQPRSLQTTIGPSELGNPCTRAIIHKLAGHHAPGSDLAWKAYIGVGMHHNLATGFGAHELNGGQQPRFHVEHKVLCGNARGLDVIGSADLFDIDSGTVVDWKVVGKSRMTRYQTRGPGSQYRTQIHLYGRGFAQLGYPVRTVMIVFLPREGELRIRPDGSFSGAYVFAEPYAESIALRALSRIAGLRELMESVPVPDLLEMYSPCLDYFCRWCKSDAPLPESTADLFGPGKELL